MNDKIERLAHIGTGGTKSWIYSTDGYSPTLPATQYKDLTKIVVEAKAEGINENNRYKE